MREYYEMIVAPRAAKSTNTGQWVSYCIHNYHHMVEMVKIICVPNFVHNRFPHRPANNLKESRTPQRGVEPRSAHCFSKTCFRNVDCSSR